MEAAGDARPSPFFFLCAGAVLGYNIGKHTGEASA